MGTSRWRIGLLRRGWPRGGVGHRARAQSQQEKKRKNILEELGLKKKPPAPAPPAPGRAAGGEAPAEDGEKRERDPPASRRARRPAPAGRRRRSRAPCTRCSSRRARPATRAGGPAQASHLLLHRRRRTPTTGSSRAFADVRDPEASKLSAEGLGRHAAREAARPGPRRARPTSGSSPGFAAGARLDARREPAELRAPRRRAAATPTGDRHPPTRRAPATAAVAGVRRPPRPRAAAAASATRNSRAAAPSGAAPPLAATRSAAGPTVRGRPCTPSLMSTCALCHRPGGPAGMTRLVLSGDVAERRSDRPRRSSIVQAPGAEPAPDQGRGTDARWRRAAPGRRSAARRDCRLGRRAARRRHRAPSPRPRPRRAGDAAAAAMPRRRARHPRRRPRQPPAPAAAGLGLPFGFMLNGRFDLNYERRHFTGQPVRRRRA